MSHIIVAGEFMENDMCFMAIKADWLSEKEFLISCLANYSVIHSDKRSLSSF